jgi:hypothetical protein
MITLERQVLAVVHALLEDVAKDPTRLVRAQQLATEQITRIIEAHAPDEYRDEYRT